MSGESLLAILLVGVIAGWLAGQIVRGTGFGLIGDLVIGIIGAFIGGWLLPRLGVQLGAGIIAAIVDATVGAIVLLLVVRLVRGGSSWEGQRVGPSLERLGQPSLLEHAETNVMGALRR